LSQELLTELNTAQVAVEEVSYFDAQEELLL